VVATAPERGDLERVTALARAAAAAGVDTGVFVMFEAVRGLERLAGLADDGVEVIACASSCEAFGAPAPAGITEGSQDDHAALVHRAHRVVAFT
jgi:peroxiredoxin family protein